MSNQRMLKFLQVSDVPLEYKSAISVAGIAVQIVMQRTGFGYRRHFLCPSCGRKCTKLHQAEGHEGQLNCQQCTPLNLYRRRQNLYDEGGTALIVWHMQRLSERISTEPINFPFRYWNYPQEGKPHRMRHETYRRVLLKLQILESMRFAVIAYGYRFTATDIRKYTGDQFTTLLELWQVVDYQIFRPENYVFLLDGKGEEIVPPELPEAMEPIHLKTNIISVIDQIRKERKIENTL